MLERIRGLLRPERFDPSFDKVGLFAGLVWPDPGDPHKIGIMDVRPPLGHEGEFEPYYAPTCACGWVTTAESPEEAVRAAYEHGPNVLPEPQRHPD